MNSIERKVAEAASDYKLATENPMFAEECGGVDKLREELFSLVTEFEFGGTEPSTENRKPELCKWAQDFLSEAASQFPQAMEYAESCYHFLIVQSDEIGPVKFAIVPPDNTEFWMAGYDTLEEATALRNEMGWRYEV